MSNPKDIPETLEDVRLAYKGMPPSAYRRATFLTALNSLEHHSGIALANIPLNRDTIRHVFASVDPGANGLKEATWVNVRSACNIAIKLLGGSSPLTERRPLTHSWQSFRSHLKTKGERNTLSSLMNWASAGGVEPQDVDDRVLECLDAAQSGDLRQRASTKSHRARVNVWNAVCERAPDLGLSQLTVPFLRSCRKRISWNELHQEFRDEVERYLYWAAGRNPFDDNARKRPLSAQSVQQQKAHLQAAADALIKSGVDICSLRSISGLLDPESVRTICNFRFEEAAGRHTSYNFNLGRTLIHVARWVGLAESQLGQIREIVGRQQRPAQKLTEKNRRTVQPFGSEDLRRRLLQLPELLFVEARNQKGNKRLRLAKLQAALAIGGLTYFAIRLANLASLSFGEHIDLSGDLGTLRIPGDQVKNDEPIEFDIPHDLALLLKEYRDELCPLLTGAIRDRVFVTVDGKAKKPESLRGLIKSYTKRYLGVTLNPHVFRHLAAKLILDENPGAHVLVQHLLGHKNLATTATFYSGSETKRAGRHHRELLERHTTVPASFASKASSTRKVTYG